jgi:hypothetical protein
MNGHANPAPTMVPAVVDGLLLGSRPRCLGWLWLWGMVDFDYFDLKGSGATKSDGFVKL